MDEVDQVAYSDYEVKKELASAYSSVFNGSKDSRTVLKDILKHCMWGFDSNDPNMKQQIHDRNMLILHIKKMINAKPTKPEEGEDYE